MAIPSIPVLRRLTVPWRRQRRLEARTRRDARILLSLDDRELDDLGLTRCDVTDWTRRMHLR